MKIQLILAFCLFSFTSFHAQTLQGLWYCSQEGVQLQFEMTNANQGTYQCQFSNGVQVQNYYQLNGSVITLYGLNNGYDMAYNIQLSGNQLLLSNQMQNWLFDRQTTATEYKSHYDWQVQEVVAQSGGQQLTQGDIHVGYEFVEFVLAKALTNGDQQKLAQSFINEFKANPSASVQEVQVLRTQMPQIYALQDPSQIALARNAIIGEMYANLGAQRSESVVFQLLEQYNPILGFSASDKLVLTTRDVDGIIEFATCVNGLSGNASASKEEQQLFKNQIIQQFQQFGTEERQGIVVLTDYYLYMKGLYNQMSKEQQQQFQQQLVSSVNTNNANQKEPDYTNASSLEELYGEDCTGCSDWMKEYMQKRKNGTATAADIEKYKAHIQSQNMYYQTMSNMMLENHATMMNVIENMGGGDSYWEVTYDNY